MKKELLLGAGTSRVKKLRLTGDDEWHNLTTLDINTFHKPDICWDLADWNPIPVPDDSFDEIHAYEVLEHIGQQGDYKTFFRQFSDYWRILKPDGLLFAACPSRLSRWAWGDPSHTRIMQSEQLTFLDQTEYTRQVGNTALSDFRFCYKADFQTIWLQEDDKVFNFLLKAIKPSRIAV